MFIYVLEKLLKKIYLIFFIIMKMQRKISFDDYFSFVLKSFKIADLFWN